MRTGVHGPTEVHYHHSTTLPAQEEKSKSTYADRKPLSDFTVAVGQVLKWLTGAKQLILQIRIIFFRRDSPTGAATLWPERGMKTGVSRAFDRSAGAFQAGVGLVLGA